MHIPKDLGSFAAAKGVLYGQPVPGINLYPVMDPKVLSTQNNKTDICNAKVSPYRFQLKVIYRVVTKNPILILHKNFPKL